MSLHLQAEMFKRAATAAQVVPARRLYRGLHEACIAGRAQTASSRGGWEEGGEGGADPRVRRRAASSVAPPGSRSWRWIRPRVVYDDGAADGDVVRRSEEELAGEKTNAPSAICGSAFGFLRAAADQDGMSGST
jgi:hypothetical protein